MLQRKGYTVHEMRHAVEGENARVEGEKGGVGWMAVRVMQRQPRVELNQNKSVRKIFGFVFGSFLHAPIFVVILVGLGLGFFKLGQQLKRLHVSKPQERERERASWVGWFLRKATQKKARAGE